MNDEPAYSAVQDENGQIRIQSQSGYTLLSVADSASAQHYLELLNRAHAAGYKAGYRDARREKNG